MILVRASGACETTSGGASASGAAAATQTTIVYLAAHLACRMTAVAAALHVTVTASAALWLVPTWLAVEFGAFNLAKWGNWHYFMRGGDGLA